MAKVDIQATSQSSTFLRPEELLRSVGIREGMNVTHFGSGAGFFIIPAGKFVGESGKVVGIDIRTQAVDEAARRVSMEHLNNVDVIRGNITEEKGSQLPDAWGDLVLLMNILHQSDTRDIFTEAARVVRPGTGRVLAVEWEIVDIPFGPSADRRVEPNALLASARLANLVPLRQFKPSNYHYAILFAKRDEN